VASSLQKVQHIDFDEYLSIGAQLLCRLTAFEELLNQRYTRSMFFEAIKALRARFGTLLTQEEAIPRVLHELLINVLNLRAGEATPGPEEFVIEEDIQADEKDDDEFGFGYDPQIGTMPRRNTGMHRQEVKGPELDYESDQASEDEPEFEHVAAEATVLTSGDAFAGQDDGEEVMIEVTTADAADGFASQSSTTADPNIQIGAASGSKVQQQKPTKRGGKAKSAVGKSGITKSGQGRIKVKQTLAASSVLDNLEQLDSANKDIASARLQRTGKAKTLDDFMAKDRVNNWNYQRPVSTTGLSELISVTLQTINQARVDALSAIPRLPKVECAIFVDNSGSMAAFQNPVRESLALLMEVLRKLEHDYAVLSIGRSDTPKRLREFRAQKPFDSRVGDSILEFFTFQEGTDLGASLPAAAGEAWKGEQEEGTLRMMVVLTDAFTPNKDGGAINQIRDAVQGADATIMICANRGKRTPANRRGFISALEKIPTLCVKDVEGPEMVWRVAEVFHEQYQQLLQKASRDVEGSSVTPISPRGPNLTACLKASEQQAKVQLDDDAGAIVTERQALFDAASPAARSQSMLEAVDKSSSKTSASEALRDQMGDEFSQQLERCEVELQAVMRQIRATGADIHLHLEHRELRLAGIMEKLVSCNNG
jgi:hypothetical protein